MLQAVFRGGKREDWLGRLRENDVPSAPLNTMDEVFKDPQVRAYGFPLEVEHPKMGKMQLVGSGVDLSRTPPAVTLPPPMLGEHSEEILRKLGYDAGAISKLREQGVI
jgi:crotonobetainyl-CoA:carnitine CoA-transferase CaiB-like acyl-CoA transferase